MAKHDMAGRNQQADRFRQIVEAAPNALVMINADGRVEMVNAQAERVFGYSRGEMVGQAAEMLVSGPWRAGAVRDSYAHRKGGDDFPVQIELNRIETEDGTKFLSAIADISGRKDEENRLLAELKEKDSLLGKIHHRVSGNLQIVYSLLDLQANRVADPSTRDMLRDTQNRVRAMAVIHQTLYASNDFATVDFRLFLDTLLPVLLESYDVDSERIAVLIDVAPLKLSIDVAVPCGLIVNELVTNALKHAFPHRDHGEIRIALAACPEHEAIISVSDNGIGMPDLAGGIDEGTLGLHLVELLGGQIGGAVTINRFAPTLVSVRFPIEKQVGGLV
jgi:PAS domain S-box-containing protein